MIPLRLIMTSRKYPKEHSSFVREIGLIRPKSNPKVLSPEELDSLAKLAKSSEAVQIDPGTLTKLVRMAAKSYNIARIYDQYVVFFTQKESINSESQYFNGLGWLAYDGNLYYDAYRQLPQNIVDYLLFYSTISTEKHRNEGMHRLSQDFLNPHNAYGELAKSDWRAQPATLKGTLFNVRSVLSWIDPDTNEVVLHQQAYPSGCERQFVTSRETDPWKAMFPLLEPSPSSVLSHQHKDRTALRILDCLWLEGKVTSEDIFNFPIAAQNGPVNASENPDTSQPPTVDLKAQEDPKATDP